MHILVKYAHRLSFDKNNLQTHQHRSTRADQKSILKLERLKNAKYERAFPYKARKLRNDLPEDLKEIKNTHKFRLRVNKELLQEKINFSE